MKKACRFSRYILLSLIMLLTGCASSQPLNTPSGKPEATIHGFSRRDILNTIVSQMTKDGWKVRRVTDNVVVVGRQTGNWDTILKYSSPSAIPENQITFTLNERIRDYIQIICSGTVVTNAGSGFENVAEVEGGSFYKEAQAALNDLEIQMRGMLPSATQDK